MGKQLTLIFNHFEREHFGKDVFLVPYYLGKALGCSVTIVYPLTKTNADFPSVHRGVNLQPLNADSWLSGILRKKLTDFAATFYPYLVKNARKIDYLMLFHGVQSTFEMAWLYKKINPHGRLYLKLDGVFKPLEWLKPSASMFGNLQYKMGMHLCRYVDCASVETKTDYEYLKSSSLPQLDFGDKLVMMPNGFDEEMLRELYIKEKSFEQKKNIIITVGRLGTEQKNTEMLLSALDGMNLNGWRVIAVGPLEEPFKAKIEDFYRCNPEKRQQVAFTGPIYDKSALFDIYNTAKVFVLTSRWESSGLVLNEAFRFHNYLVSTPVGAAADIIGDGAYGSFVPIDDALALRSVLTEIVQGERCVDVYSAKSDDAIIYSKLIEIVSSRLKTEA